MANHRFVIEATETQIAALALAARKGFNDLPPEKIGPDRVSHGFAEADWTVAEEIITGLENIGPHTLASAEQVPA